MGFETFLMKSFFTTWQTIMIASLWDLKLTILTKAIESLNYHDSFPMGFETVKSIE